MLKTALLYLSILLLGLFFQGSVVSTTFPSAIVPDVLVVLIVYVSLCYRNVYGLVGVYCLGLVADLASGVYLGPSAASAIVVFLVAGILANRVYAERIFAVVFITFVCSVFKSMTILGLITSFLETQWRLIPVSRTVFFEAAASACLAPIVIKVLQFGSAVRLRTDRKSRPSSTSTASWGAIGR